MLIYNSRYLVQLWLIFRLTVLVGYVFITGSCKGQIRTVTLQVDTRNIPDIKRVSVFGNISPLSWTDGYEMRDKDRDGVYEATLQFKTSKPNFNFKFNVNGNLELEGSDARRIWFNSEPITKKYIYNEFEFYSPEQIAEHTFSEEQIVADVNILKRIIQYIHPSLYKFRDSLTVEKDFQDLLEKIKSNPTLINAYGEISKFAAKIKCSHTFTNPWNQGAILEKTLFYQPDKIPFTFNRIGSRLFIDKSASQNSKLEKGLEIIRMNGTETNQVLHALASYVSSDGNNYEKKLDRLSVTGEEKFSLFDIFYPIEYGSCKVYNLELRNLETNEIFETSVEAISKTHRTKALKERYGSLATSLKDGWSFEIINKNTARLSIKSFAVHRNEFDWKDFLDNVFIQLSEKSIVNFIIDVRRNEGGQGEVGEYILERVIQKPFSVGNMQSTVAYQKIPKEFNRYIDTWDKFPYDFTGKYSKQKNGKYLLKDKYGVKGKTYKPHKNGFKGKVFSNDGCYQ